MKKNIINNNVKIIKGITLVTNKYVNVINLSAELIALLNVIPSNSLKNSCISITVLAIGETSAEQIKMQIGCAMPLMTEMSMEIRGRDLTDGLPRNEKITSTQVEEAMRESIYKIVDIVKNTLEKTPPELASDIMEKGIVLAGGGALIKNLDKLLSIETGMPVYIAEEPLDCVVRGAGKTLEDLERLKTVLVNSRKRK